MLDQQLIDPISINTYQLQDNIQSNIQSYIQSMESEFFIDGMDVTKYVPRYKIMTKRVRKGGGMFYRLRSDSCKTIWMKSLFPAIKNFMNVLGYETTETFEYLSLNPYRSKKSESLLISKLINRLELKKSIFTHNGVNKKYIYIVARFIDNDIEYNYDFSITFYARNIELTVYNNSELKLNGIIVSPEDFIYSLLLKMKYPTYMYEFNRLHGTLNRMKREYTDLIHQTIGSKYEPFNFPKGDEN